MLTDLTQNEADREIKAPSADGGTVFATVPCVWDTSSERYVPVYSHRGVEIVANEARARAGNQETAQ